VASAIVAFKEAALANERALDELDLETATERQEQATKTQTARFALEDVDQALAMLATERGSKQKLLDEVVVRLTSANQTAKIARLSGDASDNAMQQMNDDADRNDNGNQPAFLNVPDADELRGRVVRDANLQTSEPIYTEKFTVYNSEGAASCGGDSADRVSEIQTELSSYFEQLYPDAMIAAEERAEADRLAREKEEREAEARARLIAEQGVPVFDPLEEALASSSVSDITSDIAGEVAGEIAPSTQAGASDNATALQATNAPTEAAGSEDEDMATTAPSTIFLTDSAFRRPTVTAVGDTIIISGFRHDIELVSELMESFDKPDKQVLVEVFMVNVAKNWQRQLQSKLQNAVRTAAKTDADIAALPDTVTSQLPGLVEVRDNALIGVQGALKFADRAAAANSFTLNNFRLGLAWTIDFMESNSLGRKVSSPTILALDGCEALIEKSETRYLPVTATSAPVVTPGGQTVPGESTTTYEPRQATLSLNVTPVINPLNDHVRLKIAFNDDFFVTADANSDKIQSRINTEFIAAPGDVIVLAGLYTEDNSKTRNGLPGMTGIPLFGTFLGTSSDAKSSQEMVIFLAPEVITPKAGEMPVNSARYYDLN
jgi:type II secretory pathway component GspD/PulD (secretin)